MFLYLVIGLFVNSKWFKISVKKKQSVLILSWYYDYIISIHFIFIKLQKQDSLFILKLLLTQ